jgi:hypothetical protein
MGVGGGVQRIEMIEVEKPVFGGAEFGAVGTYERLHGTVFGELDPTHRLNAGIVNLDRAATSTGPRATRAVTLSIRATSAS